MVLVTIAFSTLNKVNKLMDEFTITPQKMKFSIKDFFSKCNQIRRKLRIWSLLLKKSLMEDFIFCGVFLSGYNLWWNCLEFSDKMFINVKRRYTIYLNLETAFSPL